MNRKRHKKVTTVGRDLFGNKRIETQWIPTGDGNGVGCGVFIALIVLFLLFTRGC